MLRDWTAPPRRSSLGRDLTLGGGSHACLSAPQLSCLQYYTGPSNVTVTTLLAGGCVENPKYYTYIAVLALIATIMLVQVSHMVKLTLMVMITGAVGVVNIYAWAQIFDEYDQHRFKDYV